MPKAIIYLISPQATDRFLNNIKQMTENHNSEQQMQILLMLSLDEWKLLLLSRFSGSTHCLNRFPRPPGKFLSMFYETLTLCLSIMLSS